MNFQDQIDYKTFVAYTALNSDSDPSAQCNSDEHDMMMNSYTLSGNIDFQNVSAYNNADYTYQLVDPYASHTSDVLEVWGKYFSDMLEEIKQNVSRRNGNAIPLDFADVLIVIASLSSLIKLQPSDLNKLPNLLQRYNSLDVSKQNDFLKTDPVLFKWFSCTFLLSGQSTNEGIASALYTSLRNGLIHNMTIGKVLGACGARKEITVASRNPKEGSPAWYEIDPSDSNRITFYLSELLTVVESLMAWLFKKNPLCKDCQRFQNDARSVLSGKSPIKLLKATKRNTDSK